MAITPWNGETVHWAGTAHVWQKNQIDIYFNGVGIMQEELKKCPFCGGDAVFEYEMSSNTGWSIHTSIRCSECHIGIKETIYHHEYVRHIMNDVSKVIDKWNHRI